MNDPGLPVIQTMPPQSRFHLHKDELILFAIGLLAILVCGFFWFTLHQSAPSTVTPQDAAAMTAHTLQQDNLKIYDTSNVPPPPSGAGSAGKPTKINASDPPKVTNNLSVPTSTPNYAP